MLTASRNSLAAGPGRNIERQDLRASLIREHPERTTLHDARIGRIDSNEATAHPTEVYRSLCFKGLSQIVECLEVCLPAQRGLLPPPRTLQPLICPLDFEPL